MNIVFFGSDNFAVLPLKALALEGYKVSCVVTQPDRRKGRGLSLAPTAVKLSGREAGLKIYQPRDIDSPEAIKSLKTLDPDLFVVVAYGQILSGEVLDIPRLFSINTHASLLPKYRGAAPINWAIIKGETTTGVTVIKMTEEMDAGPIIQQKELDISDGYDSITLEDKLSKLAAELLIDCLKSIENNSYKLTEQDEGMASFAWKLKKKDGLIIWGKPASQIHNLIRGCLGWPGAFTYYQGKLLKIYKVKVGLSEPNPSSPGAVIKVSKEGIVVATKRGNLIIEELQIEGKKRMKVEEFIAGHKINSGDMLDKK